MPARASTATSRQRARTGNRALSKDEWAAVQMVTDVTDGEIAVRKIVRRLRKSGKGVAEALAAITHPHFSDGGCGCGPLHLAASEGRLETCRFLVEELRLDVNAPGDDGLAPLSYAITGCGSTSVVRFLLDHGAKPNKTDIKGFTALHFASITGTGTTSESDRLLAANTRDQDKFEIAELLLSRGAYVDPICEIGTPLNIAAQSGNVRMLELLLRHQANPNTVAYLFYTPLWYATYASSLECVELLIKAGADVNAGRPRMTPLIVAASYGFTSGVKCLLEAGADPNIPDEFGSTAAEHASAQGWMDCVEILSPLTSPVARSAGTGDPLNANDGFALKEHGISAFEENDGFALKMQGDGAIEENYYAEALALYTKAMEIDPDNSTLYAKRSLCWLHMGEEDKALDDAYTYRTMKIDLSNFCYEQAVALILVKEYARACRALVSALKLDLRSDDLD